jgi:GT2 family glycosyltransferase/glycosyltransferase involved in cell wall biosynthesis
MQYPDVAASGLEPLEHYLRIGLNLKRNISAHATASNLIELLEKQHPVFLSKDFPSSSSLLDKGISQKDAIDIISKSKYFNEDYYLKNNPDVKLNYHGKSVVHYYTNGWKEGRKPSLIFDDAFYLKTRKTKPNSDYPPLLSYLIDDEKKGLIPNSFGMRPKSFVTAPSDPQWLKISKKKSKNASIDVIIPVYRGYNETMRCIYAVLTAKSDINFNLIIIDDCSPEPELTQKLEYLADQEYFQLIQNSVNLGFVKTVNNGMGVNKNRDVILLNSDTEVHDFWVDRILVHAEIDANVATITPFSNNATICSYPLFCENNIYEMELTPQEISEATYKANKGKAVKIPTGVGFCFYIRRAALNQLGFFDEKAFGKGYGEENDFCMRVAKAGWKNIHALDTYVYHHGETSFAETAENSQSKGLKALIAKHPEYLTEVNSFVISDPARKARRLLDIQRLKQSIKGDCVVFISHDWGGGIEKHIDDLSKLLEDDGKEVINIRSIKKKKDHLEIVKLNNSIFIPNLSNLSVCENIELISHLFSYLKPEYLHIHSLIGFEKRSRQLLMQHIQKSNIPYFFTIHDYTAICPHASFLRPDRKYCGEPTDTDTCQNCVNQYSPYAGSEDIVAYQSDYRQFLLNAKKIFAPSNDAKNRMDRFLKTDRCEFIEHFEENKLLKNSPDVTSPAFDSDDEVRVAILGAIGPHKGNDIILACLADIKNRKLPIQMKVIGYCERRGYGDVTIDQTGSYSSSLEAIDLIREFNPHVLFFPSIIPETYCYTLSLAFALQIPPLSFDIGAPAERIKRLRFGDVLNLEYINKISNINDFILNKNWNLISPCRKYKLVNENKAIT